jgi:hypothetical protein
VRRRSFGRWTPVGMGFTRDAGGVGRHFERGERPASKEG